MASERWLRHDHENHEGFADAMVKCQHPTGDCSYLGYCCYSDDCFRSASSAKSEAIRKIRGMEASDLVRCWLNEAADYLERTNSEGGDK